MKINSEKLFDYINNLGINEKVKFKVYGYGFYVTEIFWDGDDFNWESGTFSSGAFFNPLYYFEVIEEDKDIEAPKDITPNLKGFLIEYDKWEDEQCDELINNFNSLSTDILKNRKTINEITECLVLLIDEINKLKEGEEDE